MEVGLLGPLEVAGPEGRVKIGGAKERLVLALLALRAGEVVSRDALVDALWGEEPPATAVKTLQGHVARVRRSLEAAGMADLLMTRTPGYVLSVPTDSIDVTGFERHATAGRNALADGDASNAAAELAEALGLWRGDALADCRGGGWAATQALRLDELRLSTVEDRIDAELMLGQHAVLAGELESLVARHPLRERLWASLMVALYRAGRQADAVRAYQRARDVLVEELGLEPGPGLRRLEAAVLAGDPALDAGSGDGQRRSVAAATKTAAADVAVRAILMTDLEGSTTHVRALGDEYSPALAKHHHIIREAFEKENGVEVGSEGDSFAAVLSSTAAALRAAVVMQRGLLETDWPDSPWRVRVAIHAGPVAMGEAGGTGVALHEAARIRAVVHGGQVVVSEPALQAIDEPLPPEIGMTDLGLHTVRDFPSPVRLYQLSAPGLRSHFPPLRTMGSRAIPTPRTPFIGRTAELASLTHAVSSERLVTVTGAGGSGKTRLAYEAARRAHVEKVIVVELAGLRDDSQVDLEVARAVGTSQPDQIATSIGTRDLLLVMDNCEHVMPRAALLASELLDACEALVIVATSREPLRVSGEVIWHVPQLQPDDALALFQARSARTADDTQLLHAACERLGGMPLAIELAAARARSVPLEDLVKRLDDQLRLLTTGNRDVPRQQTLRATLDWSHDLLTNEERSVFRRVGVFAGGFTLDAAKSVANVDDIDLLDALDGLVMKSLVELSPRVERYQMLEPIRQYAINQLGSSGEEAATFERHVAWASKVATQGLSQLFTQDQRRWIMFLDAERDNFGAAIQWALEHDHVQIAATLVTSLAQYWLISNRSESRVWIPRVMSHLDRLQPKEQAKMLLAAGTSYSEFADDPRPIDWLQQAEGIFQALGHERGISSSQFWLGRAAAMRGDLVLAERAFSDAALASDRLDDRLNWGWSKVWLGILARMRGDLDANEEILNEVFVRCETMPHVIGAAWSELASVAARRGELESADDRICRSLEIFRELGDRYQIAVDLCTRVGIALGLSPDLAAACSIESLRTFLELDSDRQLTTALVGAVGLLARVGHRTEAATVAGAGGIEDPPQVFEDAYWPPVHRDLIDLVWALVSDPELAGERERGRRLGVRAGAEAAIEWLERAYPVSASISV